MKNKKNRVYILLTILSTIIYLTWRIFFTIPNKEGKFAFIWGIILLCSEIFGLLELIIHLKNMTFIEYPERPIVDEDKFPHVDVFIATYNEPVELLYKTVNGCLNMDYSDKNKVHIYICDDNNRKEMKDLASHLGVGYITRTERKGAKAGNYNNALSKTSSPLVVTFDADMIPMNDFLNATVPYFFMEGEKIGFVQAPQSFYNPDLFQFYLFSEKRVPNEQDYFYRDIQVGKNRTNSVIYGGSNTVISRKALEEAGGFYTKTITEDFATGMLIQSKGYKCIAIDEIHASGLSPGDLHSLLKQRERWARGCIQTGRKLNILFRKGLNFSQKVSYISSIIYWYSPLKRLVYILTPIFYGLFNVVVVKTTLGQALLFWLPSYVLNRVTLKRVSRNITSIKWRNVYETIMFPSLLTSVILETLGISETTFSVTKKAGYEDDRSFRMKAAIPHIILALLSGISIYKCITEIFTSGSISTLVVLYWLCFNFYTIVMSIFFMMGRTIYRTCERFKINTKCVITFDGRSIECRTLDISESGISIILKYPEYVPYNKNVKFHVTTLRYESVFEGKIVHVDDIDEGFKYAFKITKIDEKNTRNLLNIIYDREPTLPKIIEKNNSVFDDLKINILSRKKKTIFFSRKLPRVNINKKFKCTDGNYVFLENFNYEYVLLRMKDKKDKMQINIDENIILNCSIYKYLKSEDENIKGLFLVENYRDLIQDKNFRNTLLLMKNKGKNLKKHKGRNIDEDEFDENGYL